MISLSANKTTGAPVLATGMPGFVKCSASSVNYWNPERTCIPSIDRNWGKKHFLEGARFSLAIGEPLFLPRVLFSMYENIGHLETGFIEATLASARHGRMPLPLLPAEAVELNGADTDEFRKAENDTRECIETSRGWGGPELLYLRTISCMAGKEAPQIARATISFVARTALNGAGH